MKNRRITLLASSVVFMEWLEYALYMYLGVAISTYFFPHEDNGIPLLLTYSIFAISYIGRPLGGFIFGVYADKRGRRKPLIFSSLLAGVATAAIGVIPSYAAVGMLAPALLLICRLAQSFAVSGEFNNSSIYLIEHASNNRILAGAWIGTAASAGMFFGGVVAYLVSLSSHPNSWQIAFVVIGLLSIALACFRKQLAESPEFLKSKSERDRAGSKIDIFRTLAKHKTGIFKIAVIGAFLCVYVYVCNVYFVSYMITKLGYSASSASFNMTMVQGAVTILIPIFALLAEKTGYVRMLKICIPAIAVMSVLQFYGASIQSHEMIIAGFIVYALANSGVSACIFKYMHDVLPTDVRCTGGSLTYSVSAAVFGGTAPLLAASLVDSGHVLMPAVYVVAFSVLTYVSVVFRKPVHQKENSPVKA